MSNLDTKIKTAAPIGPTQKGAVMISTKHAMTIICEQDRVKRDAMIDKLSEEDVKYMLKLALSTVKGENK